MRRSLLSLPPLLAALLGLAGAPAAERPEAKVTVEVVDYKGWKNNLRLANGDAELLVTLDVGPRVLVYRTAGGVNVLKEFADQLGKSGEKDWQIRGGHRLWLGPEDLTRTYSPDNGPVKHTVLGPGKVRLTPAPEAAYGIQKEIDVELAPKGSRVTLTHRVRNVGDKPTSLAPWALTVMAPGGVELIPLPPKKPHPGPPSKAASPADYASNQTLVLWPFFDFRDSRWSFGSRYVTLKQEKKGPTKIGLAHRLGWVAYLNQGALFVKRFGYQEGAAYPDRGCNFETFTAEDMLEIETLGPLTTLAPGGVVELTEGWELFAGVPAVETEDDIDRVVLPKAK